MLWFFGGSSNEPKLEDNAQLLSGTKGLTPFEFCRHCFVHHLYFTGAVSHLVCRTSRRHCGFVLIDVPIDSCVRRFGTGGALHASEVDCFVSQSPKSPRAMLKASVRFALDPRSDTFDWLVVTAVGRAWTFVWHESVIQHQHKGWCE